MTPSGGVDDDDEDSSSYHDSDDADSDSNDFVFDCSKLRFPLDVNLRVGNGLVLPAKFTPPPEMDTPQLLFPSGYGRKAIPPVHRFIHRTDPTQFLIYTDGACLNNGSSNPKAGCAFVFKPAMSDRPGHLAFRLESKGPTDQPYGQTSNRAELRAVIAALRFRVWSGEGFKSIVIATDSEYVAEGATSWVHGWLHRGWKASASKPVKNQDLWQALLGECERWSEAELSVKFWRIPRNLNTEADQWAKDAADSEQPVDKWTEINGVLC